LPIWPLWGFETWAMTGFHAVGMILGAYTRGFRGLDVQAVYAAMRDTAMVGAVYNGNKELQEEFPDITIKDIDLKNKTITLEL
jgi:putative alpha-1,2-mannosidase